MDEAEKAFRDALARIDRAAPPLRPIRAAEVSARAVRSSLPFGRWLVGAAAMLLVFGGGLFWWQGRQTPLAAMPAATDSAVPSATASASQTPSAEPTESLAMPSANPIFEEARALPSAPLALKQSRNPIYCGEVVLDQGESVATEHLECLQNFLGAEDVEFAFSRPTTEGDPIVSFLIGAPGSDEFDVYTTDHWDKWGSDEWLHHRCPISAAKTWDALLRCT